MQTTNYMDFISHILILMEKKSMINLTDVVSLLLQKAYLYEGLQVAYEAEKRVASVGSGVGLYLSGQIIKAHNGKVWAESPARIGYPPTSVKLRRVAGGEGEGKGSAFFVELPQ